MTNIDLWQAVLGELELLVSKANFTTWFRNTSILEIVDDKVVVCVPNAFTKAWLENKYHGYILTALQRLTNAAVLNVTYKVASLAPQNLVKNEVGVSNQINQRSQIQGDHPIETPVSQINKGGFNQKYIFDRFIVGKNSELAYAACRAVAAGLGKTYNPLFLYGGVGLGKTHLIQAIGNEVLTNFPDLKVVFTTCEHFTNNFVQSIRDGKVDQFKKKYREVDLLLVDDVQFLSSKEGSQQEFFHTFNSLYEKQRQIVISSDRAPLEISDITDRLRSRFSMGLIADIQPPEVETKVAIIYKKAALEKLVISEEVAYFIATKVKSNIRELEGCLIKLGAHASLTGMPIDREMAKNVLKDLISDDDRPVTVDLIQKTVCEYFGIKLLELKAKKRTKEIANARQIAMYVSRQLTQHSLSEIGRYFGGKDHATVIYACKQVDEKREKDENLNKSVENIIRKISG